MRTAVSGKLLDGGVKGVHLVEATARQSANEASHRPVAEMLRASKMPYSGNEPTMRTNTGSCGAFFSVVAAHAGAEELRVGAEIWSPARRPNCQPASAFFFMKAVATFGARLDESETAIDVKRRTQVHFALLHHPVHQVEPAS